MKFSIIIASIVAGASITTAMPAFNKRQATVCSGTDSNALCCATDVLGVADLNCAPPPTQPTSVTDFTNICAAIGQQAKCCAVPILGQALICEAPV